MSLCIPTVILASLRNRQQQKYSPSPNANIVGRTAGSRLKPSPLTIFCNVETIESTKSNEHTQYFQPKVLFGSVFLARNLIVVQSNLLLNTFLFHAPRNFPMWRVERKRRNRQFAFGLLTISQTKQQLHFIQKQMRHHYAINCSRKIKRSGAHYLLPGPVSIECPSTTCTDKSQM